MKNNMGEKKNLISKTSTQIDETHKSVQQMLPTFGVRMKNNVKG